jgi:hypothetical protein
VSRRRAQRYLKDSKKIKLRRDSSVVKTLGIDPGGARIERSFGAGDLQEEESMDRIRGGESRNPRDRWIMEKLQGV